MVIAWFVSPHGFGHAARAAAIMEALHRRRPELAFEVFTRVPEWFFRESTRAPLTHHDELTDVGLVQATAVTEDLPETVLRLGELYPPAPPLLDRLAGQVLRAGCSLVICDISPLGIAVAGRAGLPSVLVENFTWDWIYQAYLAAEPSLSRYAELLGDLFGRATRRIRTEPICGDAPADAVVGPVSRAPRRSREEVRALLELPEGRPAVLLSMGGHRWEFAALESMARRTDAVFLFPGGSETIEHRGSLRLLPWSSGLSHPELLSASDLLIGKLGYSTVAELYHAGVPVAYVERALFPESPVMREFVAERMAGRALPEGSLERGSWLELLPELLELPRIERRERNGAEAAAELLLGWKQA